MSSPIKVALVHDWLTGMRGGEYVLEAITELFPRSDLFTLLHVPGTLSPVLTTLRKHVSWLQKVPGASRRYRHFLPLMPSMIERFDLSGYDLVLSSSHCVAKGILKPPGAVHVSYIHAPMRYIWDRYPDYFNAGRARPSVRVAASLLRARLQRWDVSSSSPSRIDHLIANSHYIAEQIQRHYRRDASVVYPFADLGRFQSARQSGRNYLMVSAFAPYKHLDLALAAFNRLRLPLLIVGSGQDEHRLKKLAGPTIEFLGALSNAAIADLYSKCKALVFPGCEDFGITPVEAMASGAPVIAYAAGGALETVTEQTGVFFNEQSVDSLVAAIQKVESGQFKGDTDGCRRQAAKFTRERFQRDYLGQVQAAWQAAGKPRELLDAKISEGWVSSAQR